MKLLIATLIAFSAAHAEDVVKAQQGTWKLDLSRSDFSNKPGGAPREATLSITDDGWTYKATDQSGKKTELHFDKQANTVTGTYKLAIKYEPTGNPALSEMRLSDIASGMEVERSVTAAVPGGKVLLIYGSGINADGKHWSDSTYLKKVR